MKIPKISIWITKFYNHALFKLKRKDEIFFLMSGTHCHLAIQKVGVICLSLVHFSFREEELIETFVYLNLQKCVKIFASFNQCYSTML